MSHSKADLEKVLDLISKHDVEALKASDFDQFQYQGFDPLRVVKMLMDTKKSESISDSEFRDDVVKMVAIGMIKGSVTNRNIVKMSDEGQKGVRALIKKYKLQMGGAKGKSASVLTFPRIMATFPDLAVRMVSVIGCKSFTGPMLSNKLPEAMQVQVFPALVPRSMDSTVKKALLTASLCYSIDQSIQISQIKEPELKTLAGSQSNFTMVGHQSPIPSQAVRLAVFNGLNLDSNYKEISEVLLNYKKLVDPEIQIPSEIEFKQALSDLK
jgi:hypothetical protein